MTTSAGIIQASIADRTNTACRAQRKITSRSTWHRTRLKRRGRVVPMAGVTVTEELELAQGRSGGGGSAPGGGGGDGDGSAIPAVPQRAYITGMTVALAGILMFFMAL